jgi:alpha-2-macroglobulin
MFAKFAMVLSCFIGSTIFFTAYPGIETDVTMDDRNQAQSLYQQNNFNDAYQIYLKLLQDPQAEDSLLANDYRQAWRCLQSLSRTNELDGLREQLLDRHPNKWRLRQSIARSYLENEHYGFLVAGEFIRGNARGGGEWADASEYDRSRALQILIESIPLAENSKSTADELADFYLLIGQGVELNRTDGENWRLQALTDLNQLPEIEANQEWGFPGRGGMGRGWGGSPSRGAPVDEEGNPIFYEIGVSWEESANDGQRLRWAREKAATIAPQRYRDQVDLMFARFLWNQFGVQTMAEYGRMLIAKTDDEAGKPQAAGPFAVATLKQTETIARLASGIKRFDLPEQFNHIRLFQQLAQRDSKQTAMDALITLATIFENRQQYPLAAEYLQQAIELDSDDRRGLKQRLDQIIKPWGMFEGSDTQPAGRGASLEFRFRNGKQVNFIAQAIDTDRLLNDTKRYLSGNPQQVDWDRVQLDSIGYTIFNENMNQYLGAEVAKWTLELEPRPNHFDRRITVTTPLQKAGAYLLTAKMADGNTCHIVLWVADTVIARKQIDQGWLYMVADAITGQPVPHANVEFIGWRNQWRQNQNRSFIEFKNFAEVADQDGFLTPSPQLLVPEFQWVSIARSTEGRLAFLGFNSVWSGSYNRQSYQTAKVYGITDRPIYRPGQTMKYNVWARTVSYLDDQPNDYAQQKVRFQLRDPQGNELINEIRQLDDSAALSGQFDLPPEAPLGVYTISISDPTPNRNRNLNLNRNLVAQGNFNFRVEEYKKPEFEVSIKSPDKPVALGEAIPVTIKADYYFGGPVTEGVVNYKVHRSAKDQRWFPIGRWDWLYGNGYRWLQPESTWYPGFNQWGCFPPLPPWWGQRSDPPELVIDEVGKLNENGELEFTIDTAIVKELFGDKDHEYTITAEVVDASRRTIVGSGSVIVAHRPFSVYVWASRGYARTGDVIEVSARARTPNGAGVQGTGKLVLYRIQYDGQGVPSETELQTWNVVTDENGSVTQQIKATEAGQFRLAFLITDPNENTIEGGQLLHVVGGPFDSANFRYNDLEAIVEKVEYEPGEKLNLLLQSNRAGARVMVFEKPSGVYAGRPQVIVLDGKSSNYQIEISQSDMPNFFIEVMTIFDGKLHTVTKEIFVPPTKKVVNVELIPQADQVLPGAETEVQVKLTDPQGRPFTGSMVMTMYDRSIEYISGGSNVPDIREFFWKWKRSHNPRTEHSLTRSTSNLVKDYLQQMSFLGVFGSMSADAPEAEQSKTMAPMMGMGGRGGGLGGRGAAAPMARAMSAPDSEIALAMDASSADSAPGGGLFDMEPAMIDPVVRTEFADAAFWSVDLQPNSEGIATATIKMPENLSAWKVRTWVMGPDTMVGEGTAEIRTAKNIMVRLQAPRFFVEKDEVVLSAVVQNYLDVDKRAEVSIDLGGNLMTTSDPMVQMVNIPAGGSKRVDWRVTVVAEGETAITMAAKTDVESDAMRVSYPILVHGMLKTDSYSGIARAGEPGVQFHVTVPAERRPEASRLEVRYSPTLAGAMVDALPYLNDYPYGCTEQTLNRFLPTVITLNVLRRMEVDLKDLKEKRTNLNAQEIGDDQERAKRWEMLRNPVFDEDEVLLMAKTGVADLTRMQNSDGGWGWFSGRGERSWPHTTATVVRGLQLAAKNEIGIVPGVLEKGVDWLTRYQSEQVALLIEGDRQKDLPDRHPERGKRHKLTADNVDALVFLTLVEAGVAEPQMADFLYRDRGQLSLYGQGLIGLAYDLSQDLPKRDMLIQNISQFVRYDKENQTAYIDLPNQNYWWFWYGDSIEANAIFLKLMSRAKPKDQVTVGLVKYLINNRRHGRYWKSTRDTALCIEAFADYMAASGEDRPEMTVEVVLDSVVVKTVEINRQNLFSFDNQFVLEGDQLTDGEHVIEIRRSGKGNLYANAYLTNFTLEDPITAAGLEIKVQRAFYRLEQVSDARAQVPGQRGQVIDQMIDKYQRIPLQSWDEVKSGDLIEIEFEIDSKNDYEYVIFEDMKAAGCEPVELRSGYVPGSLNAYVEFRDQRVAFFTRTLSRGKHSYRYRMRAEIPGQFSALPTKAWAMYAPELKANSDEMKLKIADREDLIE